MFEAVDNDGGSFGDVTFEILQDSENGSYFSFSPTNRHQSELSIIQIIDEPNTYSVIEGGSCLERISLFNIKFHFPSD